MQLAAARRQRREEGLGLGLPQGLGRPTAIGTGDRGAIGTCRGAGEPCPARESAFMGGLHGGTQGGRASPSAPSQLIRDPCHGQRRPEAAAEPLDQPLPRSLAVCAAGAPRRPHHAARTPRRRVRPPPPAPRVVDCARALPSPPRASSWCLWRPWRDPAAVRAPGGPRSSPSPQLPPPPPLSLPPPAHALRAPPPLLPPQL